MRLLQHNPIATFCFFFKEIHFNQVFKSILEYADTKYLEKLFIENELPWIEIQLLQNAFFISKWISVSLILSQNSAYRKILKLILIQNLLKISSVENYTQKCSMLETIIDKEINRFTTVLVNLTMCNVSTITLLHIKYYHLKG